MFIKVIDYKSNVLFNCANKIFMKYITHLVFFYFGYSFEIHEKY